jgi:hypothetical protein
MVHEVFRKGILIDVLLSHIRCWVWSFKERNQVRWREKCRVQAKPLQPCTLHYFRISGRIWKGAGCSLTKIWKGAGDAGAGAHSAPCTIQHFLEKWEKCRVQGIYIKRCRGLHQAVQEPTSSGVGPTSSGAEPILSGAGPTSSGTGYIPGGAGRCWAYIKQYRAYIKQCRAYIKRCSGVQ